MQLLSSNQSKVQNEAEWELKFQFLRLMENLRNLRIFPSFRRGCKDPEVRKEANRISSRYDVFNNRLTIDLTIDCSLFVCTFSLVYKCI